MALGFSTGLRNAWLDSIGNEGAAVDFFDAAILEIRSGSKPANADAAPTGTLLASITLPANAMNAAASGAITLLGTWADASNDATGTAGYFRFKTAADGGGISATDKRIDGTVTGTGGGGDCELDTTTITIGGTLTITACTLSLAN